MIFRIRFHRTAGGHVRCRLSIAPGENRTFAMCGEFTVREGEEFAALCQAFSADFIADDAGIICQYPGGTNAGIK